MNWKNALLVGVCAVGALAQAFVAKVGVLVVDDGTGKPLRDITVTGTFSVNNGWGAWGGRPLPNKHAAVTDINGRCRVWGRTNCGRVGCWIKEVPPGYYVPENGWGHRFKGRNLFGLWQPDNLVATIRLQRVERPIPLLVKRVSSAYRGSFEKDLFPRGKDTLRYDLLAGDWLPPVGTGQVADVTFTRNPREDLGEGVNLADVRGRSFRDSMTVEFPGPDNGLVEIHSTPDVRLKIRTAPEGGYRSSYRCWYEEDRQLQSKCSYDEKRCFCFRIRTRRDEEGKIVEAYYGKVYGDVFFAYQAKPGPFVIASVCMGYYLNPTSLDRNLEWDRRTNLFSPGEPIRNPNSEQP